MPAGIGQHLGRRPAGSCPLQGRSVGAVRALIALCLVGVACAGTPTAGDGNGDPVASVAQWPSALQRVVDEALPTGWMARGDDLWQVFICDIPVATTVTLFDSSATRLTLDPVVVATR